MAYITHDHNGIPLKLEYDDPDYWDKDMDKFRSYSGINLVRFSDGTVDYSTDFWYTQKIKHALGTLAILEGDIVRMIPWSHDTSYKCVLPDKPSIGEQLLTKFNTFDIVNDIIQNGALLGINYDETLTWCNEFNMQYTDAITFDSLDEYYQNVRKLFTQSKYNYIFMNGEWHVASLFSFFKYMRLTDAMTMLPPAQYAHCNIYGLDYRGKIEFQSVPIK